MTVQIDGRPLTSGTETHPIRLAPKKSSILSVDVVNHGTTAIAVKTVRLEGRVVGLTFFAYDTAVGLTVPPGGQGSRRFTLDLGGLDGQATGLVPGAVKLLDNDRHELASTSGVVDVRGSLRSVYGLFGVGVALLTVVSFLACVVGLARHRLHPNRWRRAMRFLTPGIGLGLFLNFTLSATRVFVPAVGRWLTIVVVCSAVFFGLGYLTPAPDLRTDDELEEEEAERAALRSGSPSVALPSGMAAGALGATAAGELGPPAPPQIEPVGVRQLPARAGATGPVPATGRPLAVTSAPGQPDVAPAWGAVSAADTVKPAPATTAATEASEPRSDTVRRQAPPTVGVEGDDDEASQSTTIHRIVPGGAKDEGSRPTVTPDP